MMETILTRPAIPNDLPRLAELREEKIALLQQADRRFAATLPGTASWIDLAASWLADTRCHLLVAESDDLVIGYIAGWVQAMQPAAYLGSMGLITEIAIDTHIYRGGLGRALLRAMRAWFSEQEVAHIAVFAPRGLAVEQAFWRSLGASQWIDLMWIT